MFDDVLISMSIGSKSEFYSLERYR